MNNQSTNSNSTCRPGCGGWATVDITTKEKKTEITTKYYKSGTVTFRYRGWFGNWVNGSSHLPFCDKGKKDDIKYTLEMSHKEKRNLTFPTDACKCKCSAASSICESGFASLEQYVLQQLDLKLSTEVSKKEKEMSDEFRKRVGGDVNGSIVSTYSQSDSSIIAGVRSSHPTATNISINRGHWRMYGGRNPERSTSNIGSKKGNVRVEVETIYGPATNDGPPICPSSAPSNATAIGYSNLEDILL